MYIWTKQGLAQEQESWSAPQSLPRVVRSIPFGYLGVLSEQMGNAKQTCYIVDKFKPNSWLLTKEIQLGHLEKIAKFVAKKIAIKLRKLRLKKREKGSVHLFIEFRGYMDKKTDTGLKNLDERRLKAVHEDLDNRIKNHLEMADVHHRFNFDYFMNSSYAPEGSDHPVDPDKPEKNRRVEVCILEFRVRKSVTWRWLP